jgi:hypothetical protein
MRPLIDSTIIGLFYWSLTCDARRGERRRSRKPLIHSYHLPAVACELRLY